MSAENEPLLSICIPTYNHAGLLRLMLSSLAPQVKALEEDVELIISDNCSSDSTPEVIEWAQQFCKIRYNRNRENIGGNANMMLCANELARGKFCWLLGDDDMIVKDKLPKIVSIMKSNPKLDYFFVNYFFKPVKERDSIIQKRDSKYDAKPSECWCRDFKSRHMKTWEELFGVDNIHPSLLFTTIVCSIFRRSSWNAHSKMVNVKEGSANLSIDNTFPHVVIIAHAMVGKPAFYFGEPCVLAGQGQEWGKIWPLILLFRMNELIDLYESLGVDSRIITICRNDLLNQSGLWLIKMIIHPDTPGRQFLTIGIIFRRFLSYGIFWKSLIRVCLKHALDKISPHITEHWQS